MKYFSSIASSCLGNIIEWYDFGLFTIFSALFSKLFFPTHDEHAALLATISIFTIGFLCRPIGALLFGFLGDKFGRASTLRLSILMITLPTLLIGCLPTYEQVGISAPIALLLTRMWQGISIGGEYSGNIVYLAENAPKKHRALFTSFASMGSNLGILLAACVGIIVTQFFDETILMNGMWRLPYLLSGLISLLIYIFRLRIQETQVFNYAKQHALLAKNPISVLFKNDLFYLLRTFGLVCMGTTFYYFTFIYLPIFLTEQFNFSSHKISILMSLLLIVMIFTTPLLAIMCDYIGRRKMLLINSLLILICLVPGYYFLQLNLFSFSVVVLIIFSLLSSSEQSTTPIAIVENFPLPARYTGVAFGYNLGNGLLGGTVPFVCAWSVKFIGPMAPAFYVALCALITFVVVLFFVPETKGKSLKQVKDNLSIQDMEVSSV